MIIVADFYRIGSEHVPVNACLLYMIADNYVGEEIHFYGEEEHCFLIRSFWNANRLTINNVSFHEHRSKSKEQVGIRMVFSRMLSEFFLLQKLSGTAKKARPAMLFFLSLSSVNAIAQKLLWFKNLVSIITLHGDVEFIRLNNDFTRNFLGRCLRKSFQIKNESVWYLVLDLVIKENLIQTGFLKSNEILAIPHPYIFSFQEKRSDYKSPFKIAHIGVASMEKQTFLLFKMADFFTDSITNNQLQFLMIGRNENIPANKMNNLVIGAKNKSMLAREDFENAISNIHYSIFFYNDIYQLTGSGAILDAFNFEKPIIALKNELFNSIFERAGHIGFLCDNLQDMQIVIQKIISGEINKIEYEAMQYNMRNYKIQNSPGRIKDVLFSQIEVTVNKEIDKKYELV